MVKTLFPLSLFLLVLAGCASVTPPETEAASTPPEQAETRLSADLAYLAENAKKEGVTVTNSGLQYEVLLKGQGAKPNIDDTVTVHYTGRLVDGTLFDSSLKHGVPIELHLRQLIKGWSEGLQLMSEGAIFNFVIPSKLAYGVRGAPPDIPADATLVYEIELVKIVGLESKPIDLASVIAAQPENMQPLLRRIESGAFEQNACPANAYNTVDHSGERISRSVCEADLLACMDICEKGSQEACFWTANAMQSRPEFGGLKNGEFAFPLYMQTCRLGHTNGCVNAVATAKNGHWNFAVPAKPIEGECQKTTFQLACDKGSIWGCRMILQEAVSRNKDFTVTEDERNAAKTRTCELSPNDNWCGP